LRSTGPYLAILGHGYNPVAGFGKKLKKDALKWVEKTRENFKVTSRLLDWCFSYVLCGQVVCNRCSVDVTGCLGNDQLPLQTADFLIDDTQVGQLVLSFIGKAVKGVFLIVDADNSGFGFGFRHVEFLKIGIE